jgi:hypothetical protein
VRKDKHFSPNTFPPTATRLYFMHFSRNNRHSRPPVPALLAENDSAEVSADTGTRIFAQK